MVQFGAVFGYSGGAKGQEELGVRRSQEEPRGELIKAIIAASAKTTKIKNSEGDGAIFPPTGKNKTCS